MFENEARVLIILPQEFVDRARVFAGKATTSMKLPVSLQIVFRALIEEGLKRPDDRALLANIAHQAETVRRIRSTARRPLATGMIGANRAGARREVPARRPRRSN